MQRTRQTLFAGLMAAWSALPCSAGLSVLQIIQVPASQQQKLTDIKVDASGNLVACGTAGVSASARYGFVKKIDSTGKELFSRWLPGASGNLETGPG